MLADMNGRIYMPACWQATRITNRLERSRLNVLRREKRPPKFREPKRVLRKNGADGKYFLKLIRSRPLSSCLPVACFWTERNAPNGKHCSVFTHCHLLLTQDRARVGTLLFEPARIRGRRGAKESYCNVTTTSITPLPESRLPSALPITAPSIRLRSVPFIA
jgi:hypothetical protein